MQICETTHCHESLWFYLRFSDAAVYPQVDAAVAMQDSDYGASTPLQYLLLKSHC